MRETVPVFFEDLTGRWARALPAADFDDLLVRRSRRTREAALPARFEVCFCGAFRWESALPPEVFDFELVDLPRSVLEAAAAAARPVTRGFAIWIPSVRWRLADERFAPVV